MMTESHHDNKPISSRSGNVRTDIHALEFAKARIRDYYESQIQAAGEERRSLEIERDREMEEIREKIDILKTRRDNILIDSEQDSSDLISIIRSGCEIYLKDLEVLKRRTKIMEFGEEIGRVAEMLESTVVRGAEGGMYDKYYSGEYCHYCGALIPVKGKTCKKCVRVLKSGIANPFKGN